MNKIHDRKANVTPEHWRQIAKLYSAACEAKGAEKAALLSDVDPEVRARVERMLAQDSDGAILDRPAGEFLEPLKETIAAAGTHLGPYKIVASIGSGGMGTVYRAVDTRLNRAVALKIAAERYSERFTREAQAISTLNHPHICTLYDVGSNYLVMELLEGATLADEINKGPLAQEQVVRYGAQIASALAEAHAHGIVHRDLKPGNIMVTRHGVKVLDFGLAKMLSETKVTEAKVIMGTPLYMAPEQVQGQEADARTDLFTLGLVLYEMASGRLPFPGVSLARMLVNDSTTAVPPTSTQRAGIPANLDKLIATLLSKEPARRMLSAGDVDRELSALANRLDASPTRSILRPAFVVPAAVLLLSMIAGGALLCERSEHRRWALEKGIPEIGKLAIDRKPLAAFLLLQKAEQYLPGDPRLTQIDRDLTRFVSVKTTPAGSKVELQDYLAPESAWFSLGTTTLDHVKIPKGQLRWRVSKPGAGEFEAAPSPNADIVQLSIPPSHDLQAGMVPLPAGRWRSFIGFIGFLQYELPAYDMDRFEVTNRQFQDFVDQGGYRMRKYWKETFKKYGKELTWEQGMDLFRDPTGRPGPSTWTAGHFPTGQADYPVSGVSWYEAAAYASFAGKSLPTLGQWYKAAPPDWAVFGANVSNFGEHGPVAVGASPGVGPYGTYDMAGNVREWCLNADESDNRFILGGAWRTQNYQAIEPEALLAFDRSPMNGFRTVRNRGELLSPAIAPIVRHPREFSKAKPVSDDVFQAYRAMYAYDKRPLDVQSEGLVENTPDWTKAKITIDAGYEHDRLPVYVFLPKNVRPPFQAVVFSPSARVNQMPSSNKLGDLQFVDYIIQSGRAVLYPIYQGTYERGGLTRPGIGTVEDLQLIVQQSKEIRRSVDYLETRPEQFDRNKLAYLGVSQGSAYGVIFATLEDRFKTVIFLDGGFFLGPTMPARDQVNFAPRLKKPVLMVNGRYDFTFPPDQAQLPLLNMIGTPAADKRRVVSDTPHDVSQDKPLLSKEVLGWLDRYLGRVN